MTEQPYDSEALLQELLADHPALLAGEQMTEGAPRRWLLVQKEASMAGGEQSSWYVDHLFLDQEGIPTLVEVKRSSDTRIRREVIGQMLDYAAGSAQWSVEDLRARFATTPEAEEKLAALVEGNPPEEFWERVRGNLESRRIRMVFVADEIPPELRRVVDFLAAQLRSAEIYAVEVRKFDGGQERVLVPQLVSRPKEAPATPGERQWNEKSFFEALRARGAGEEAAGGDCSNGARGGCRISGMGRGRQPGRVCPDCF